MNDYTQTSIGGIHHSTHSNVAFLINYFKGNIVHSIYLPSPPLSLWTLLRSFSQSNLTTPFFSDQPPLLLLVVVELLSCLLISRCFDWDPLWWWWFRFGMVVVQIRHVPYEISHAMASPDLSCHTHFCKIAS